MAPNNNLITALNKLTAALEKTIKDLAGTFKASPDKGGSAGGSDKGGILGGLTGALGETTIALTGLAAVATLTAGALNPNAVENLMRVFRDLTATVGVAFEPAIAILTKGVEQVSAAIMPLMLALRPILARFAEIIIRMLVPAVRLAATVLTALTPLLTPILALLDGFADIILTLSVIFQTLVETISEFIASVVGSSLADASKEATKALQYLAQQLILFVATIAAKLGQMGFVAKLIDNFKTAMKPPVGGPRAGGPVTTTNLDAIVKKMAESAGKAGGFAGPSPEEEAAERERERQAMLNETLQGLIEIQKTGDTDKTLEDIKTAAEAVAAFALWVKETYNLLKGTPAGSMKDAQAGFEQGLNARGGGRPAGDTVLGELGSEFGHSLTGKIVASLFGKGIVW